MKEKKKKRGNLIIMRLDARHRTKASRSGTIKESEKEK